MSAAQPGGALPPPAIFPAWAEPRYRCIRRISQASDATVWLVRISKGDGSRLHVLKELHGADVAGVAKSKGDDWLPREVELLTSQNHPFILPVVEMLRDDTTGQMGMVTEYCDQGDLHSLLNDLRRRGERVPEGQLLTWLAQLCLALSHLHRQRILHRDVKTSNIFVTADRTLKLGDFGLARALQAEQEAVQSRVGSPFYMSPEICLNQPYASASDVWSLGCVVYEIICLTPAFYAESMALVLDRICSASYAPPPEGACSEAVRELLGEMLQLQPAARPSAASVLQHPALHPVLKQLEPAAPPQPALRERLSADSPEVDEMRAAVRAAAAAAAATDGGGASAEEGDARRKGGGGSSSGGALLRLSLLAERGLSLLGFSFPPSQSRSDVAREPTPEPAPTAAAAECAEAAHTRAKEVLLGMRLHLQQQLGMGTLEAAMALAAEAAPDASASDAALRAWEAGRLAAIIEQLRQVAAEGDGRLGQPPPAQALQDADAGALETIARAVLALALWHAQVLQASSLSETSSALAGSTSAAIETGA